jgi:translation initiation factor IF-2
LAKRIFEIAKELGIESKAIVEKCRKEGIGEDKVKGHMSTISVGLEATIREWFSEAHDGTTAVEESEKVDLAAVKVRKPRSKKAKENAGPAEDEAGGVATQEAPKKAKGVEAEAPAAAPAPSEPERREEKEEVQAKVITPVATTAAPAATVVAEPAKPAEATRVGPTIARSSISMTPPTSAPRTPPKAVTVSPVSAPGGTATKAGVSVGASGASAPVAKPPAGPEKGPGTSVPSKADVAKGPPPAPRPVVVAPQNVPQRPTVVTPAGPRLQAPTAVKLSGPKVVRVEAPEQVEAPRPRRTGPGAGGTAGGSEDDRRSRSPRHKQGAGAGASAGKRSSGTGVPDRRRGRSGTDWVGSEKVFSEQDLIEREARLARAGGFLKKHKQELQRSQAPGERAESAAEVGGRVKISAPFTIKDLSAATGVKAAEIVKKLFMQGTMATVNSGIDVVKAQEIMMDFDIELEVTEAKTAEETVSAEFERREVKDLRARGPVVTILGHVDHGKTSLLDKIRNANVAAGEAGGITQKTSAFVTEVEVEGNKRQVVFLDTPGHEAFTGMRARGAKITDVVVLVVSAPEGVMPQTIESINHAKAAKVPIVVALNKVDRPDATESQIQKTLGELANAGLNPVEWGGDTEVVKVSALTGKGIQQLLETLDYQAQLLELKADFGGAAQGTVIEAKIEEGRGAVANVLIQQGKLEVGDFVVMGRAFGRIRDITDDKGKRIKEAHPPMPVQISGVDMVCDAGDKFYVTTTLRAAEEAAEQRRHRERQVALAQPKLTLDNLFTQMQAAQDGDAKEIRIILKTDQQGTVDVLKNETEKIKTAEVKTRVIHAAVGGIMESDVTLADASRAIIIGFNVIPSGKARQLAEQRGIEIRTYQVIYDITDDLKKAAEGLLAPEIREEVLGHAEVRAVFKISKVGSIAGCYVTDGTVQRDALIRVTRNGVVVEHDRRLAQLKRVKDDAKEVRTGMECGMKIDGYDDIKEGDVLECYKKVEVKRTL